MVRVWQRGEPVFLCLKEVSFKERAVSQEMRWKKNIYRYHTHTPTHTQREEKDKGTDFGSPVLKEKKECGCLNLMRTMVRWSDGTRLSDRLRRYLSTCIFVTNETKNQQTNERT